MSFMRATLSIPDNLIEELMQSTRAKTKTQAICLAIEEYTRRKKIEKLLSLQGKLDIEDTWKELEDLELKEAHDAN
jgi:Arc/MetJ family transcription regulator